MKNLRRLMLISVFALGSLAVSANDIESKDPNPQVSSERIENRILEIWRMDFNSMDKSEKLELKEEVKNIKKELKTTGLDSKVSISVGAIIIILLLLILI